MLIKGNVVPYYKIFSFPSYQLSSFPIYSFAPRHPARFLFYITDFFSPALPLRILFCKGNAGDCSNTKSSIAFDRKIFLCVQSVFSLPIWLLIAITLGKQKYPLGRQEKPPK